MPDAASAHLYPRVLEPFSQAEIRDICQLKRLFEWAQGDPGFAASLAAGSLDRGHRDRLKQIGVEFDVEQIALLWQSPDLAREYVLNCSLVRASLSEETAATLSRFPLLALWARFSAHRNAIYRELRKRVFRVPASPAFDSWRMRRIKATRSELGLFGHYLDHPILAFELGDGCSIGCWFCAFSARKLSRNLDYRQDAGLFRGVLETCVDLFGRDQSSMALLYYGTEPHDNPGYLDFLRDFESITGGPSCTSTAVGTDPQWIRSLIAYYRGGGHPWPRISVLTATALRRIHDLYSPEELRDVELLIQTRDHRRPKVTGGRILQEQEGLRSRADGRYLDSAVPQGSIACVSGFLSNLVNRTVQLVSPCYTSATWPYGYRVFDAEVFADAADFRRAVAALVERNMQAVPALERTARFRDDLRYRTTAAGFDLVSPNQIHHLTGQTYAQLGALLAAGDLTFDEVYEAMLARHGTTPMVSVAVVQKLFDDGLLDEVQPVGG